MPRKERSDSCNLSAHNFDSVRHLLPIDQQSVVSGGIQKSPTAMVLSRGNEKLPSSSLSSVVQEREQQ